jgi:DNA polymerase
MTKMLPNSRIIFLDFETYYDKSYKIGGDPYGYIRDERFKIHGMAIRGSKNKSTWITKNFSSHLNKIDWSGTALCCHNSYFDAFVLHYVFDIQPAFIYDTYCMSRALYGLGVRHSLDALAKRLDVGAKTSGLEIVKGVRDPSPQQLEQLGTYACNDNDIMHDCFWKMDFPYSEYYVVDVMIKMFTDPRIIIDKSLLEQHLTVLEQKRYTTVSKAKDIVLKHFPMDALQSWPPIEQDWYSHVEGVLGSNLKFSNLMAAEKIKTPKKMSEATNEETDSFSKNDQKFLKWYDKQKPYIKEVIDARMAVKSNLELTRTERLIEIADKPLPINILYHGAHTGRGSGQGGLNPQNNPRGSAIRKAYKSPEGYWMVVADSSQIEARINPYLANDPLIESFRAGVDVYKEFAATAFKKDINDVDKYERFVGKVCQLQLGYQSGGPKLQNTFKAWADEDVPLETAERYKNLWRKKYRPMVEQWYFFQDMLQVIYDGTKEVKYGPITINGKGIRLPNGIYIQYPDLKYTRVDGRKQWDYLTLKKGREKRVKIYGGKVTENVVQALARIVVFDQMVAIGKVYKVVLQVHDEVVYLASNPKKALEFGIKVMSTPPEWALDLPVAAEGGYAKEYSK